MPSKKETQIATWVVGGLLYLAVLGVAIAALVEANAARNPPLISGQMICDGTIGQRFTTLPTATWTKLNGFEIPSFLSNMKAPAVNKLRYVGSNTVDMKVTVSVALNVNASVTILAAIVTNGNIATIDDFAIFSVIVPNDGYMISFTEIKKMNNGDYLEVWVLPQEGPATVFIQGGSCALVATTYY